MSDFVDPLHEYCEDQIAKLREELEAARLEKLAGSRGEHGRCLTTYDELLIKYAESLKVSARVHIATCISCNEDALFWSVTSGRRCDKCKTEDEFEKRQEAEKDNARLRAALGRVLPVLKWLEQLPEETVGKSLAKQIKPYIEAALSTAQEHQ